MVRIRRARLEDLPMITEIYNDAIIKTVATFDTKLKSIEEQKEWFETHGERHPILVAEIENKVVGWASLSKWSDRCAYSDVAEISLYIEEGYRGRGIGKKLTKIILREGKAAGLHTIIARVAEGNAHSIHILEKYGFNHIGIMKEVGKKFGKLIDVHLLQKIFK
jgi:L-amino acid N-acyltransferase YncA